MPLKSKYVLFYEFVVAATIALGTLLCLFPPEGLFFKWWEEHAFVIMLSFLVLGLVFFFVNLQRLTIVSFGACASLCLLLNDRTEPQLKNPEPTSNALVKVAQFSYKDIEHDPIDTEMVAMLRTEADLISVQEIPMDALPTFDNFFTCCGYPYLHCTLDATRRSAMVVYSRYDFNFIQDINFPGAPGVVGKVQIPLENGDIRNFYFFSSFFYQPDNLQDYDQTKADLEIFARQLNRIEEPLLVFGDYHLVSWSKELQEFRQVSRLKDSRRGLMPTWPHGYVSLFDYPFDHIFYSNHFKCINFETISSVSTTHLGIVGTYEFENKEPKKDATQTSQKL